MSMTTKQRKIAVFTGTRAEYGLLRPLLQKLDSMGLLQLIVSGTHLSSTHGQTIDEIIKDGFQPTATIAMDLFETTPQSLCSATGSLISDMGQTLKRLQPDLLVILGDRYESFAAATAATLMSIPIAHICGGEITQGAMDDVLRHAITKLSHLHFTSCETYRQRVIQLGESPHRVWNVGSLGVENIHRLLLWDEETIRNDLNFPMSLPYLVGTFHPVTLESGKEAEQLESILTALENFPEYGVIFTGANADTGGNRINQKLEDWAKEKPNYRRFIPSLGVIRYLSAVKYAAAVVGNSSSGVVELPSLGTPIIDIGNRQAGRLRSPAVLHCPPKTESLIKTLQQAFSPQHRNLAHHTPNPYDKSGTSEKIIEVLLGFSLHNLTMKHFHNLPMD